MPASKAPTRSLLHSTLALLPWLLLLQLIGIRGVTSDPWNLPSYTLCRHTALKGVPAEASGVTYSPVTNSLYVITRNPQAVVEYNLEGRRLREVPYRGLSDPEGITWMYDYTFAVAQEGRATAAITVMDLLPWRQSALIRRKLVLNSVRCKTNLCFEGITYDVKSNVFYALQEMRPMRVWRVNPGSGTASLALDPARGSWPGMRDLAGAYFRANSTSGLYLLSQATQNVARVHFNGTLESKVQVRDNMVEGLTFTPDGVLMITVGEPNDLWVYTSTGECEWKPSGGYRIPVPPTQVQHERQAALVAPIDQDPDGGYCNWNDCNGEAQGNRWCNRDVDHCVGDCKGTWCWWDGIGLTITPENYEPPAGAVPAVTQAPNSNRTGFCSFGSCDDGRSGPEQCHSTPNMCLLSTGCGGSFWCWEDGSGEPLHRDDLDENATVTPAPTLNLDAIPDNISVVKVEDETFRKLGYEASLALVLENLTISQFTPLQQLYFRQAIAHVAYGTPNAFLQVVFNTSRVEARHEWATFKDYLVPATLERLASTQANGQEDDVIFVNVFLLGETSRHAQVLGNRTMDAVKTGGLLSSLTLLNFERNITVTVASSGVAVTEVSPQYFPAATLEDVFYRDSFNVVDIEVIGNVTDGMTQNGTSEAVLFEGGSSPNDDSSSATPRGNRVFHFIASVAVAALTVLFSI